MSRSALDSELCCSTAEFARTALDGTGLDVHSVNRASASSMAPRAERSPAIAQRSRVFIAADSAVRKGTESSMASVDMVADRTHRPPAGRTIQPSDPRSRGPLSRCDDGEIRIRRVDHADHLCQTGGITGDGDIACGDQCAEIRARQQDSDQNRSGQSEGGVRIG